MNAKFFDYASNLTNAAEASAVAKVRSEVASERKLYRVEWTTSDGLKHFWEGGRYDVLCLAKGLFYNHPCEGATMTDPAGKPVDIASARY
jgi:hypothetical protein